MIQAQKRRILNGWLGLPGRFHAELAARAGYDWLTIDMQHGHIGWDAALAMLQTTSNLGVPTLVRVPSAFDHVKTDAIMAALDAGAAGVIVPQMDSVAIAQQIVAACQYPPRGRRSFGPMRAAWLAGAAGYSLASADANAIVIGMIESQAALDQLDAILAVPGLSGVYIGPNDLSLALGVAPSSEPTDTKVLAAIERIRVAAQSRGLLAGIFCSSGEAAAKRLAQGFDVATPGADGGLIAAAHARSLHAARNAT